MTARISIAVRVRKLMADGEPRTACEIAEAIGASDSKVGDFLRVAREPGRNQEVHAIDKGGKFNAARYVIGKGENAFLRPSPVSESRKAEKDMTEDELDALHRARARWWTPVDVLVLQSINAMVRMGASHANR